MRRTVLAVVLSLAACGDPEHKNPFDPATPAQQQATTSFSGTVSLEAVGGVAPELAGVAVSVAGRSWSATTDAAGAYEISDVPPGAYTLQAVRAGYETAAVAGITATLDTGGTRVTVPPLALRRVRADLVGTVLLRLPDATFESTGGASISVAAASGPGAIGPKARAPLAAGGGTAVTGADGGFVISDLPAPLGSYTLTAAKYGYVTQTSTVTFQDGAFVVSTLQLVVDPGAIVGSVAVAGSTDAFGVTVRARGSTVGGTPWEQVTTSDAAGAFRLSGLPAGSYAVSYERADLVTSSTSVRAVAPGEDTTLEPVTLNAATGAIRGVVQLAGMTSSSAGVVVTASGPGRGATVTDSSGAFALAGLPVGGYTVVARKDPDWQWMSTSGVVVARDATTTVATATLSPFATASIGGFVALEGGAAPAGSTVTLSGADFRGVAVSASVPAGVGGGFSFSGLVAGSYQLAFSRMGYEPPAPVGVSVSTGQAISLGPVTLAVSRGTIAGTVALSPGTVTGFAVGTDFSGAVVTLAGTATPTPATVTDASGAYRFEGVPVSAGGTPYTVTASKPWFTSQSVSAAAVANGTYAAAAMTLPLAAGCLRGVTTLTYVPGGGDGLASANVGVSIAGTAFNGTSFATAATSGISGAWTSPALPPGSYDVVAAVDGWRCAAYPRVAVGSGAPTVAGTVLCLDAVAPSALVLGPPAVTAPQQAGYTAATSLEVPLVSPATDANVSAYQLAFGASPDWSAATSVPATPTPVSLTFAGLAADGRNVLWARAVDSAGNAGPAASLEVVQDSQDPARPALSTSAAVVSATSATVSISGSEGDANFYEYLSATATVEADGACAGPSTAWTATPASASVNLAANHRTCFYARAVDRAGRLGPAALLALTSDLVPPTGPTLAPLYDPSLLTIHAEYADFFVTAAATDLPAGGGEAWKNVAWVEVDTGSGYRPLCPAPACHPDGVYAPCSADCACADARLVCDGAAFKAIRVPLLDGTSNAVGIRAVDLAGNVGSGASQLVATATSLLPVSASSASETHARGRGRLVGYRYTDSYLRLHDLGADGRPGGVAGDDHACDVGLLGTVLPRVAVLGPAAVVHGDGNQNVTVRRPGADGGFCSPDPIDDVETPLYAAPAGTTVLNVTGSYDRARTGEYAAWAECTPLTAWGSCAASSVHTVKVKGPDASGRLAPGGEATLFSTAAGTAVTDLLEGGDCLVTTECLVTALSCPTAVRVDCKAGGLGNATGVTTWTLPAATRAAALSSDGALLAWLEEGGTTPGLHVRAPGPDGIMGNGDDTFATRLPPGAAPEGGSLAIEAGHLVLAESTRTTGNSYWLVHWSAGPDGVFEGGAAADDTISRVLPSSGERHDASILTGGLVAYGVYGLGVNLADVLASDLSTFRWEAIEAAGVNGLATNGAGTLFFHRGTSLTARLPDGSEQQATPALYAWSFAADGASLLTVEGSSVNLRRRSGTSWFGTPLAIYTGTPGEVAAGRGFALVRTSEGGNRYRVADLSAATPTTTLLPILPGTSPGENGFGVSDTLVAYQCLHSGAWGACFHYAGADHAYATGGVLERPGSGGAHYQAAGLAVSGNAIAFRDGSSHMIVATPGPNGLFNDADDVHYDLGPAASGAAGTLTVAGNYAAWLQIPGANGVQVIVANLPQGTQRQVTSHYSMKELLAMDPSGRLAWIDYGFSAPAIFLYAP